MGVVFDIGGGSDFIGQFNEVVGAVGGFQVVGFFQFFCDGEQIDRL